MKKWITALVMLALLVTGCAKKEKFVVDTLNHTISDGSYTYEYSDTVEGDVRTIVIRYPDGGTYTWTQDGGEAKGNMQCGTGISRKANGAVLLQAILNPQAEEPEQPSVQWLLIVVGVVVAGIGLLEVLFPVTVWNIFMRWYYKEDPGEYALTRIISGGLGGIVVGIGVILLGIFG